MKPNPSAHRRRWVTAAVFGVSLAVRLLFWQATPDRSWPHSALYKGDAVVWTQYAAALSAGQPFELGLPLRPPANAYLLRWLGVTDERHTARAKAVWCLLGALAVTLFYRAALAAFGSTVALITAVWCAFSSALLMLATSLNNETPYLVLVGGLLLLAPRLATEPTVGRLAIWGALNGLACLVRVEHLLFFLLASVWLAAVRRRRVRPRRRARHLAWLFAVVAAAFAVVLLPWHVAAWSAIREFNTVPPVLDPAGEAAQRSVERATRGLVWTPEARTERARLPAFARRASANFVAATVLVRGGRRVEAADFAILDEAFGDRPRPLPAHPFVALYGPLNFYLANREGAPPGFDRAGLDRRPPLAGGPARYPMALLRGLPPRDLNFFYPPHVEVVNEGYRLGWAWIRDHPGAFLRRAAARVGVLWQGAALGWTGYNLPWGSGGVRRAVDLTVPRGAAWMVWRGTLAALCLAGLWAMRQAPALPPWLLFVAARVVAAALFFGYARHGATLVPVVALLAGAALARIARLGRRELLVPAAVVAALGLAVEVRRWADPPAIVIDGQPVTGGDPHPLGDHLDRLVVLRRGG